MQVTHVQEQKSSVHYGRFQQSIYTNGSYKTRPKIIVKDYPLEFYLLFNSYRTNYCLFDTAMSHFLYSWLY
jgi:hypothetical protein